MSGKLEYAEKADTSNLQDDLQSLLIDLAKAVQDKKPTAQTNKVMLEGLFTTITNVNFDNQAVQKQIDNVKREISLYSSSFSLFPMECGGGKQFDINKVWSGDEDIRSLKSLILFGIRGMAAYAYHALVLGYTDEEVNQLFYKALSQIADEDSLVALLALATVTGKVNLRCMELLDRANTETYGIPVPTNVPLTIEKGPFIVISGHDLHALHLLLEQTKDKGINIYTHGEMLPAHAYPKLKAYSHLKGNFGTAWQNQQKEFDNIPAPVLFTTNCLMPVKESYKDRIFTTEVVAYPEMVHIGDDKDFTPVIEKALELGGYSEDKHFTGINGGSMVTTGFARSAVLSAADKIIDAVKSGAIRHFFLVGGCDGAKPGRNYYTEFVKKTPKDTVVLTLACGKYRFNDLDIQEIEGLPNFGYGAVQRCLQCHTSGIRACKGFECDVNELPLTLVLSWYEQKAVCILLTLCA